MKKVCVLGHFGFGKSLLNGQTIKTKIVTDSIIAKYGSDEVIRIDTHGGMKNFIKTPFQSVKALKVARNIIIFPAYKGVRVYAPLLVGFRAFFRGRKLHYVVIGGWLPSFLNKRRWLAKCLKKFECIYVETNVMKEALELQGFENIIVMRNCKSLTPLKPEELVYSHGEPYKLCTFSRVMREKGIEDAVNAVNEVNRRLGRTVYELDIFGQIDSGQVEWFEKLQKSFPKEVRYRGLVSSDKSVEILKDYFVLLFPTHYRTEGIPGTIIDAYAAGIPVLSAKWESFSDIVDANETGVGYDMGDGDALVRILLELVGKVEHVNVMKIKCIEKSRSFLAEEGFHLLFNELERSV